MNNKAFHKLIIGQTVANIGDTLYTIAIISSVFALTNSAIAASIVPIIITGSMVVSGLLTPLIVIRVRLTRLLQVSQSCKTLLLFGLAIYLHMTHSALNLVVLYGLIAAISFFDGCSDPVSTALIPHYVSSSQLIRANSIFSTLLQVVNIGSWAIGSTLLVFFSVTNLVWLNVGLFALSTIILWCLPSIPIGINQKENNWEIFQMGWQEIRQQPLIRVVVRMDILESIANTTWVSAIVLVFVKDVLHVSQNWWGYINATFFAGAMIGSLLVMHLSGRINQNKATTIFIGSFFGSVATLLVAPGWHPIFVLICSIFVGIFSQIKNIPQATAVQQTCEKEKLVAIYAAMNVLYTGTTALSTLLMGVIADFVGVQSIFIMSGILLFFVALITKRKRYLFDRSSE